jgi:hypothetical protein
MHPQAFEARSPSAVGVIPLGGKIPTRAAANRWCKCLHRSTSPTVEMPCSAPVSVFTQVQARPDPPSLLRRPVRAMAYSGSPRSNVPIFIQLSFGDQRGIGPRAQRVLKGEHDQANPASTRALRRTSDGLMPSSPFRGPKGTVPL